MSRAEKIREVCMYPGTFIFSLSWAWETRRDTGQKGFLDRFADAMIDAHDVL